MPGYASLQRRAALRQSTARAKGTEKGRWSTVKQYLSFTHSIKVDPLHPDYQDICAWIEVRVIAGDKPLTIRNKLSHLRVYVSLVGASTAPFLHPRVTRAVDALLKDKSYTHRQLRAIPVKHLKSVLLSMPRSVTAQAVKAAILVMYHGALRQSEVAPPSIKGMDYTRHLTRGDLVHHKSGITITVKWAKNMQQYTQQKVVHLARAVDPMYCVVAALERHIVACPTRSPSQPLFVFEGSTRPIPVSYVRRVWISANRTARLSHLAYTLHSLRRAAATQAHLQGCDELDIQRFGGWQSNAHRAYIKSDKSSKVNKAIRNALCT